MLPHAGQGAAQALEDAVEPARTLPRNRSVVALAGRNARIASIRSGWGTAGRDWAIRHVPESVILRSLIALGRLPS
jgi:hypothetical protein